MIHDIYHITILSRGRRAVDKNSNLYNTAGGVLDRTCGQGFTWEEVVGGNMQLAVTQSHCDKGEDTFEDKVSSREQF